jgi:hypothetical protein
MCDTTTLDIKCPLNYHPEDGVRAPCIKQQCAWWDAARSRCAVVSIPHESGFVAAELSTLSQAIREAVINLGG